MAQYTRHLAADELVLGQEYAFADAPRESLGVFVRAGEAGARIFRYGVWLIDLYFRKHDQIVYVGYDPERPDPRFVLYNLAVGRGRKSKSRRRKSMRRRSMKRKRY